MYATNFLEIVIVDDTSGAESRLIERLLNEQGYQASIIDSARLESEPPRTLFPDLLILFADQIDGDPDKITAVERHFSPGDIISLILVTDSSDQIDRYRLLELADDYVRLPIKASELLSKVAMQAQRQALKKGILGRISQLRRDYKRLSGTLKKLTHGRNYDPETGLASYQLALAYLDEALIAARREHSTVDLLMLEIEVKAHDQNEALLSALSALNRLLAKCDLVAQVSQQRLIVVLDGPFSSKAAAYYTEQIEDWARQYNESGDGFTSVLISHARFPSDGLNRDQLLLHAEEGLTIAQMTGGWHQESNALLASERPHTDYFRSRIKIDIRSALIENQFFLCYQPQVDAITHKVVGCEVLMRWKHPEFGLISPDIFIPILEKNGMIGQVGAWVIEESIQRQQAWVAGGLDAIRIAVNFSIRQLTDPNLGDWLTSLIAASGLAGPWFELEITETASTSSFETVKRNLEQARSLGMQVAIDDFGTGNATLNYLQQLPVDVIKIDRQFVISVMDSEQDAALLQAIVSLATTLGKDVIAEGVETEAQASFLKQAGCKELQGYFFGKPMPADEFERFLARNQTETPTLFDINL